MKIAEKLSELHQQESKLQRLLDLRDSITTQDFETKRKAESISQEDFEKLEAKFFEDKSTKVKDLTLQVDLLRIEIVNGKASVNRANVKSEMDLALSEIGFLKLELSKLMKVSKDKYSFLRKGTNTDSLEAVGLLDRITELEKKKAKLESSVQAFNWSTNV